MGLIVLACAGCDDQTQQPTGGGPGSSTDGQFASGDTAGRLVPAGPCAPAGGTAALGTASYASDSTAKVDTDGDPNAQGQDVSWQSETTGGVNAGTYNFVVMSRQQMRQSGASIGDWAQVTNDQTGQTAWAKVEDVGPKNGTGEISEAAAASVGISTAVVQTKEGPNTVTVGSPSVSVNVYGGSAGVQSDCDSTTTASL